MNHRKAFTLIELLVVIAIIGLLMAVILPSLRKAKQAALNVICKNNLRQWGMVFVMYADDNGGSFHGGWAGEASKSNWWMDAGRLYYDDIGEFRCCPTATRPVNQKDGSAGGPGEGKEPFAAWGYQPDFFKNPDDYGSYGVNGWLENKPDVMFDDQGGSVPVSWKPKFWRKKTTVKSPSQVPLILEAKWIDTWPEPSDGPPSQENLSVGTSGGMMARVCQNRHNERQDVTFVDGSVETIGLKKLWKLKWHRDFDTGGPWTLSGGATRTKWESAASWMAGFEDY